MKEIKAIIRPFKMDDVVSALHNIEGLPGMTISAIKGVGKSRLNTNEDPINKGLHELVEKVKIEIVVENGMVKKIVNAIQEKAHTGNPGDGKIFVIDVSEIIKIRTNERGTIAI